MSKSIPGYKDENGIYTPVPVSKPVPEAAKSIDDLLKQGLTLIQNSLHHISKSIVAGQVDREMVGCLKDCMTMLHELKKKEKELLDNLSDDELTKLIKE